LPYSQPLTAEAYLARAIAKNQLNDREGAIKDLTTALEINPNYARAIIPARGIIARVSKTYKGQQTSLTKQFVYLPSCRVSTFSLA
jgi:tetratricopeptide (TPR) repeat protein